MTDENNQNNHENEQERIIPLSEERGLPPVNRTPKMPTVKPPKPEENNADEG